MVNSAKCWWPRRVSCGTDQKPCSFVHRCLLCSHPVCWEVQSLCFHLDLIYLSFPNPSHTHHLFTSVLMDLPSSTLDSILSTQQLNRFKWKNQITTVLPKAFSDFLVYILRIKSKAFEIHCLPWPCLLRLPAYSIQAAWVFRFLKYAKALRGLGGFMLTLLQIVLHQIFAWLTLIHKTLNKGGLDVNLVALRVFNHSGIHWLDLICSVYCEFKDYDKVSGSFVPRNLKDVHVAAEVKERTVNHHIFS